MTDQQALLAAVRANPDDDTIRGMYADWLCDRNGPGDWERAELIGVQCRIAREPAIARCSATQHSPGCTCRCCSLKRRERELWSYVYNMGSLDPWFGRGWLFSQVPWHLVGDPFNAVVSRGFIGTLRGPLAAFWEERECGRCARVMFNYPVEMRSALYANCPECKSHGRVSDPTAALVAVAGREPVTTCIPNDKRPDSIGDEFCWIRRRDGLEDPSTTLPPELFDLLTGGRLESGGEEWASHFGEDDHWRIYPTEAAATAALSDAILRAADRAIAAADTTGVV